MIDLPPMVRVAALGDSITAGSPLWDPDPEVRRSIGAALDERSQWEWWAARAHPGFEFRNCGVYGERAEEIERRLEACAAGADVLVVQGGINDVAQGRRVKDAAAALRRMVRCGLRLGLGVALADVLPWNNGWPGAEPAIRRLNELVHAIGREEGVPVLPFHTRSRTRTAPAACGTSGRTTATTRPSRATAASASSRSGCRAGRRAPCASAP